MEHVSGKFSVTIDSLLTVYQEAAKKQRLFLLPSGSIKRLVLWLVLLQITHAENSLACTKYQMGFKIIPWLISCSSGKGWILP